MIDLPILLGVLGRIVVASPALLVLALGATSLLDRRLSEDRIAQLVRIAGQVGGLSAVAVMVGMLAGGERRLTIDLGNWVTIGELYHFSIKFVFDRLSVPFAILSFALSHTIGAFASRYMHRERGYNRFFALYAIFMLGMVVASLAGTIETLFAGWEMVGLSSALLVAFFQERAAPPRNGLWVWTVYRVSDAALLLAAVVMHHLNGQGDFAKLLGAGIWPDEHSAITSTQALGVGVLLLIAAAGKSALVPFSGWLPRAMEGPTPSSAVFYGALSVHLGAFLLLRVSPLLELSTALSAMVVAIGLLTAAYGYVVGSVQTDIKSALSFASLSQVGLIVAEIGLGMHYVPLVHILGHACLRTLQFVRAPTLLQDYHLLENAIGDRLPRAGMPWARARPLQGWAYRAALERGYFDTFLSEQVVGRFVALFRRFDRGERRWTDYPSGGASREAPSDRNPFGTIEEFS